MLFSEEQEAVRDMAMRFAREVLQPGYLAREQRGALDRDLIRELGNLGFLGTDLPEDLGGLGADSIMVGLVAEALGYGDFSISQVPVNVSLNAAILRRHAPRPIVEEWVPQMVRGEKIMSICLTEPRGGSDAANIQLRARKRGSDYVLTGEKTSITFATEADIHLVFARTGPTDSGARGISAFFIPEGVAGIATTGFDDVGCRQISRGSVFFEDVVVPAEFMLGDEGGGFSQVMQGFDYSRALIALECCGAAQASLDEAWAYARTREAFGRPIGQFQNVSGPLADHDTHVAATRQLAWHTLQLREAGRDHTAEAAMCKWLGPKVAFDAIHQALLTEGHYGYVTDSAHQQRMRDVLGLQIGDGTAGVMKQIIARSRIGRAAIQY